MHLSRSQILLGWRGFLRISVMPLAFMHFYVTTLTNFEFGNVKALSLKLHKWVALAVGPTLAAIPWSLGFGGGYQGTCCLPYRGRRHPRGPVVSIQIFLKRKGLFCGRVNRARRRVLRSARYEFRCARWFLYFVHRPQFQSALRGDVKLLNLALQIRRNAGTVQTLKMKVPLQGHYLRNVAHAVIAGLIPE